MFPDLLTPPAQLPNAEVVHISQQAPQFLKSDSRSLLPYPLSLLLSSESPEKWESYQNLFLSCLRTGDDKSAWLCLERLTERFGNKNERIMALHGMYKEATAKDDGELQGVLRDYEGILKEDPTNVPVRKRKVALLRSMGKLSDATEALVELVDASPTDSEAWAELSDLYVLQNMYQQAIFSLEEVLVQTPGAWNVNARLGELLLMSTKSSGSSNDGNAMKTLSEAMRRFCRSIELCDDYLRGYYGLKVSTARLLEVFPSTSKPSKADSDPINGDPAPPTLASIQKLNQLATQKLGEIVRKSTSGEPGWVGYDQAEVIAARALLDGDTQKVER